MRERATDSLFQTDLKTNTFNQPMFIHYVRHTQMNKTNPGLRGAPKLVIKQMVKTEVLVQGAIVQGALVIQGEMNSPPGLQHSMTGWFSRHEAGRGGKDRLMKGLRTFIPFFSSDIYLTVFRITLGTC